MELMICIHLHLISYFIRKLNRMIFFFSTFEYMVIYETFPDIDLRFNLYPGYTKFESFFIVKIIIMRQDPRHDRPSSNAEAEKLYGKVRDTIQKNKQSQLFYKAFLKPIEIALKTHATQNDISKVGCMPYGIKQVFKTSIDENKFTLLNFKALDQAMSQMKDYLKMNREKGQQPDYNMEDIKQKGCDNLISLLKPISKSSKIGLKVAICVCMYSEDKSMLKRTLSGISQNIKTFALNGISPNQVGVFVIMDGIQVVDSTVEQYFQDLQKQNNIYLADDVDATDPHQLIKELRQVQDEEVDNINHLIFSEEQFEDRKKRRFSERRKQYKMNKDMIKQIQKLEKDKTLTYQTLDSTMQKFFMEKARQQWKKDFACTDEQAKLESEDKILEAYAQNYRTSQPIIRQALNEAKKYCSEYISTRDNLALLNSFRVPINMGITTQHGKIKRRSSNYEEFQEDKQNQQSSVKMNLFMVTKYKNRGKLSSHNWFFNGFCMQLNPQFAVLLDVGLTPEKQALWRMCKHMEKNEKVGGVCGYMGLRIERLDDGQQVNEQNVDCFTRLCMKFVDIQRAQQFQYHFAHLIDKPFQATFDFIHVLPGAFSAYRMKALRPDGEDSKLLREYFKSIDEGSILMSYRAYPYTTIQTISRVILPDFMYECCYGKPPSDSYERLLYDQNVYLAEDRTLCMGIHQNNFQLAYLPDANAWVDPIKTLYGLLGQRKRWINGSFFAFQKVKQTLNKQSSGDCLLRLQIFYLNLMNMLAYIAPALFMFTIHIAMFTFQTNIIVQVFQDLGLISNDQSARNNYVVGIFVYIIDFIYVLMFLGLIFYSMHLTNRQGKFKSFFYGVSTAYGIFSIAVFGVLIFDIISGFASQKNDFLIQNKWFVDAISGGETMINSLRFIMLAIMSLYVIPIVVFMIYGRMEYIIDILFSTFSFIFYSPTYLNILNIYALCRIDDISWGTKGLNAEATGRKKQMTDQWTKIKIIHVSKFVLYNIVVGFLLLIFGSQYVVIFYLTLAIMIVLGSTLSLKVILGAMYLIKYRCCTSSNPSLQGTIKQEDQILLQFKKVKNSLYKSIQASIVNLEPQVRKQVNKSSNEQILISAIILSSKMAHNFKHKYKKPSHEHNLRETFSKIQKDNESKALMNINRFRQLQQGEIGQQEKKKMKELQSNKKQRVAQKQSFEGTDDDILSKKMDQQFNLQMSNMKTRQVKTNNKKKNKIIGK